MPYEAAVAFVEAAVARLWEAEWRAALAYLTGSECGLTPETVRAARHGRSGESLCRAAAVSGGDLPAADDQR